MQYTAHTRETVKHIATDTLVNLLGRFNDAYRKGAPEVTNEVYDYIYVAELRSRDPEHPFLMAVEVEDLGGEKVRHSTPMLSTDKLHPVEVLSSF